MSIRYLNGAAKDLSRFVRGSEGSVATIFAVALVPVLIAAGIGIDMSRAMSSRSNLQDALDATALALAHLPASTPQETINAKVQTWLAANLHDSNISAPAVTATLSKGQIVLDATAKVTTTLTAIAGYKEIPVTAHSTVKWGIGRVEVALVLDNTGSMFGAKLTRLKAAAADLVETLEEQISGDDPTALKNSVVPFSMTVRLSSNSSTLNTYKTASWMTGTLPSAYGEDIFTQAGTNRFTLFSDINENWGGCVENRFPPYDVQDTAPSSATPASLFVPFFAPDEPDDTTTKKGKKSKFVSYDFDNNYLDDETNSAEWKIRQGNRNKYDENPDDGGPNDGCTMSPILRLTTNVNTVKSTISSMNATGNTNIPTGLMWGWHTLSPNPPFSDGVAYSNGETKKFLVLLTDGDNVNSTANNPNNSIYSAVG